MKNILISVQLLFASVFFLSFIVTFFVKDKILDDSREIITKKVSSGISTRIDLAEELLHTKQAKAFLADYQIEVIQKEISRFRSDPDGYVSQMTLSSAEEDVFQDQVRSQNPLKDALVQKVIGWKESIREHFNKSFAGLVFDIRIFLVSNVIGLLGAAFISWKSEHLGKHALAASKILTVVIVASSSGYINSNWLYDILLNSYAGMTYPTGIIMISGWLFFKYYQSEKQKR